MKIITIIVVGPVELLRKQNKELLHEDVKKHAKNRFQISLSNSQNN